MTPDPHRVLIAEDHPMFRDGLRALLTSLPDVELVGEAEDGIQAVSMTEELQPDVVVMDLHMPGLNGIEATRRIARAHPHVGVLVLTMLEDDDSVFAAMRAGARGYMLKGATQQDILRAVESVARGEAIFAPTIARRVIDYFARPHGRGSVFPELTARENEILDLIARGRSNSVIANHLVLSEKTVRNHVSNIFAKLQVADRAEAIVRAREAGLGEDRRTV
ncbi:MAG: response regulator [Actinomycetota bacterium]